MGGNGKVNKTFVKESHEIKVEKIQVHKGRTWITCY